MAVVCSSGCGGNDGGCCSGGNVFCGGSKWLSHCWRRSCFPKQVATGSDRREKQVLQDGGLTGSWICRSVPFLS